MLSIDAEFPLVFWALRTCKVLKVQRTVFFKTKQNSKLYSLLQNSDMNLANRLFPQMGFKEVSF